MAADDASDENETSEVLTIDQCIDWARAELVAGTSVAQLRVDLIESGWSRDDVERILHTAGFIPLEFRDRQPMDRRDRSAAITQMAMGAFLAIAGIGVSVATYVAATMAGTRIFLVTWGAAVSGLIIFYRGYSAYRYPQLNGFSHLSARSASRFGQSTSRHFGR